MSKVNGLFQDEQEAAGIAACKAACLAEWDNVNDPPCHPGDDDWRPCPICIDAVVATRPAPAPASNPGLPPC